MCQGSGVRGEEGGREGRKGREGGREGREGGRGPGLTSRVDQYHVQV